MFKLTITILVLTLLTVTSVAQSAKTTKTVRLHIDGFSKSKSGAVWMAWPESVKQALEELAAVRKIEMLLDRDEFVVTFDPAKATEARLIAAVRKSGYTAQVVSGKDKAVELMAKLEKLPTGFSLLDDALAQAKRENKPLVLDFNAEWCVPCRRMERTTLADSHVIELLKQVVFVRIDTDLHSEIARKLNVVGLPDIRFASPDGRLLRQLRGFQTAESFAAALQQLIRQTASK